MDATRWSGDADEIFIAAYAEREALLRWVYVLTRDAGISEEVAQEAYLRLLREIRAGRCPDNVGPWLRRVAANLVASLGRRSRVAERRLLQLAPPSQVSSAESAVLVRERMADLVGALDRLTPERRSLILMAAGGADATRLASELGVSPDATRARLCRARAQLRQELAS